MSEFSIKETKEVLDLLFSIYNATDTSLADDGQISWTEYVNFLGPVTKIPKAVTDINLVPKELGDIDEAEKEELKAFAREKLDLADDVVEEKVENLIDKLLDIFHRVMEAVEIIKTL